MRPQLRLTQILIAGLVVGCTDAAAPNLFGPLEPEFAIVPSVSPNGQFAAAGSRVIVKGFNPVNPRVGDAIIATFFWSGSVTITSVTDRETNGRPVGNTYNLVETRSAGGINMATYVQLDAAIPNYFLQEAYPAADLLNEILVEPLVRDGGYVVVPDRPGIGVELREDKLAKFPYQPHTIKGWFREDGSVAH